MVIQRSWFRHLLTLRPFLRTFTFSETILFKFGVASLWDGGFHADEPLRITFAFYKWQVEFGIRDTN